MLVVRGDDGAAIPVAFLDGKLVPERGDQLVACRRRKAAELDIRTAALDRRDPGCLLLGVDADKSVEIGQARPVIVRVALAGDRLAGLVLLEAKRPRAEDVLLVPMRVAVEDRLFVEEGVWVRQRRQKRRSGEFEAEHDGMRVDRLELVDKAGIVAALR